MAGADRNAASAMSTDDFIKGLWRENPVFVQVLGMCPVLAVTNSAINALAMGLATTFVLVLSNTLVATLRHFIPRQVRIATFILIIATFVTVVDYLIQAISLDLHRALGAFISLIVVNCLILGRAEAFASKNSLGRSLVDGVAMGIGFTLVLTLLGAMREIIGLGTLFSQADLMFGEIAGDLTITLGDDFKGMLLAILRKRLAEFDAETTEGQLVVTSESSASIAAWSATMSWMIAWAKARSSGAIARWRSSTTS